MSHPDILCRFLPNTGRNLSQSCEHSSNQGGGADATGYCQGSPRVLHGVSVTGDFVVGGGADLNKGRYGKTFLSQNTQKGPVLGLKLHQPKLEK